MKLPIALPPWTKQGKRLESATRKALYDYKMLDGCDKLTIALSGGKDSMTLLYLLNAIKGRGFHDFEIKAVCVEGEFSCGAGVSINMLRDVCEALGVAFETRRSIQTLEGLACYRCSRERRKLIFEAAHEWGSNTVAFGHHRDDDIQTLMMNLCHKGEFAGLLPDLYMQDYDIKIIRPLIYLAEDDIRRFAEKYSFGRVMCQCPVGQDSMRKEVEDLISKMERSFPNIRKNLAHASKYYGSEKARNR